MIREARRLALLRRQGLIAEVARKQALRGLAEAIDSEARSHALAARSRMLIAATAPRLAETTGAVLAGRASFTASLVQLASTAGDAAHDAARQTIWQAETLARAETRARRLAEREAEARAAWDAAKAQRAQAHEASTLARKLQRKDGA
jgi:membrane protein involved in colicin uptake